MSKNNGNGKGIEKYHFDNPDAVPTRDGISIMAVGEDETPTEIQIMVKVPGARFAPRVSFKRHEMLTDIIEQLIAYRRLVFPDAPEINTNATLDGMKNETDS